MNRSLLTTALCLDLISIDWHGVRKIAARFGVDPSTVQAHQPPFRRRRCGRVKR